MITPDQSKCGYCEYQLQSEQWKQSPHGRPYCPHCKAIPAKFQRSNGWRDDKGKDNLRALAGNR